MRSAVISLILNSCRGRTAHLSRRVRLAGRRRRHAFRATRRPCPASNHFELAAAIENRRDGLVSHQLRQFPHHDVLFDRPAAFAGRVLLDLQWRVVTALLMQDHLNLVIFDAHEDFTQDGADNPLARRYCRGRMRPPDHRRSARRSYRLGLLPSPAFSPQIAYIVQIDVAEKRQAGEGIARSRSDAASLGAG